MDCRVLAATNSSLADDTKNGRFREDLYYRLRVVTLTIPKLRERKEDIPLLAQRFIDNYAAQNGSPPVTMTRGIGTRSTPAGPRLKTPTSRSSWLGGH